MTLWAAVTANSTADTEIEISQAVEDANVGGTIHGFFYIDTNDAFSGGTGPPPSATVHGKVYYENTDGQYVEVDIRGVWNDVSTAVTSFEMLTDLGLPTWAVRTYELVDN